MEIKDITPGNIRNFVEGNKNFIFSKNLPQFYLHQFYYRAYLCRNCLSNGKCVKCGCHAPAIFFAPRKHDALDRWPEFFFSEDRWEEFKSSSEEYSKYQEVLAKEHIDIDDPEYLARIVSIPPDNISRTEQRDPISGGSQQNVI